jgi:hypothetical protein
MKNNETFQTTQHLDKLVTNLGLQIQELFSLDLEEILDYSNNLMNLLVSAYVKNQCLALSAMISKQDGFAIYSFLFQTPDTSWAGTKSLAAWYFSLVITMSDLPDSFLLRLTIRGTL